jgi:hypothetical protein
LIGLIPRNGKLRGRDRAPKPAQTGHGDNTAADQNAKKPTNSGPFRQSPDTREITDWVVVWAVRYKPVSTGNSLLSGKLTGNAAIWRLSEAKSGRKAPVPQRFPGKTLQKLTGKLFSITGKILTQAV